jgi:hypothetical protein
MRLRPKYAIGRQTRHGRFFAKLMTAAESPESWALMPRMAWATPSQGIVGSRRWSAYDYYLSF